MSEPVVIEPAGRKRLTLTEPLKIQYCVETWLRDEQVRVNTAKVKGRIEAANEVNPEPIALVNFGPSLNQTWEQIRGFKHIMTCSGAHKFLVERGIIPTLHIDVDPREHKIALIGTPQKGTEYLIASTCHPKLFDFLLQAGCNVKLWHIFDNDEHGIRVLPHGEWAITGGCSVGVRTMTIARFLGFVDLHIFGMDGCFAKDQTHAADHPNRPKGCYSLDYAGKEYLTTPSMLEAVKNTWHELDMMKDVRATFYGDGLVQAMSRDYKRQEIKQSTFIGFAKPELISAGYRELNRKLHEDNLAYGVGGGRHAPTVLKLVDILAKNTKMPTVLDYGCGKSYMAKALPFPIAEYDPAVAGKEDSPRPADLVCCLDVLEHIEPERLDFVLDDIRRCTRQLAYFAIYTQPSSKFLSDGRNSHLIIEGRDWWQKRLSQFFVVPRNGVTEKGPVLSVVCSSNSKPKKRSELAQTVTA